MEQENLPLAVSIIRQVHDIDLQAAKASDDYGAIQQAEREVKIMVQNEFNKSIEENNINKVMSLCPLLQTLSLEEEARDTFLTFVEKTVFIAVSADASAVDDATDPATGYAQALSNVFNSTYMILQRYVIFFILFYVIRFPFSFCYSLLRLCGVTVIITSLSSLSLLSLRLNLNMLILLIAYSRFV